MNPKFDAWLKSQTSSVPSSNFDAAYAVKKYQRKLVIKRSMALGVGLLLLLSLPSFLDRSDKPSLEEELFIAEVFQEHEALTFSQDEQFLMYFDDVESKKP